MDELRVTLLYIQNSVNCINLWPFLRKCMQTVFHFQILVQRQRKWYPIYFPGKHAPAALKHFNLQRSCLGIGRMVHIVLPKKNVWIWFFKMTVMENADYFFYPFVWCHIIMGIVKKTIGNFMNRNREVLLQQHEVKITSGDITTRVEVQLSLHQPKPCFLAPQNVS